MRISTPTLVLALLLQGWVGGSGHDVAPGQGKESAALGFEEAAEMAGRRGRVVCLALLVPATLYFCEFLLYYVVIGRCRWPEVAGPHLKAIFIGGKLIRPSQPTNCSPGAFSPQFDWWEA